MRGIGRRRVRVSINMAMSMDGKIATPKRGPVKLGTAVDSLRMSEIRAAHDAVINGASTFRAYPFPLIVKEEKRILARLKKGEPAQPISAVVSSDLAIPRHTPWEQAKNVERWIFCGNKAPATKILSLEKSGVKVVRCKGRRPSPKEIIAALASTGVKKLLLEGGGEFNASFLEAGLVQQIHLTMTPLLIGGAESPTWAEGKGFSIGDFPRFRLKEAKKVRDELYLTYVKAEVNNHLAPAR